MSTKTTFKRVALVAVASMGFGMLSVVPSNATAGTAGAIAIAKTSTVDAVALAASKYTSAPVLDALQVSAISVEAGTTVILHLTSIGGTFTATDETKVAMRGYGIIVASAVNAATADGIEDPLPSFVATSVPGTYTLDVTLGKNGTYAVATDLTTSITMVVTAGAALSSALTTRYHAAGAVAGDATTDLVPVFASKAAATNAGNITVTLKRTDGTAFTDTSSTIYASVTGAGLVDITADQTDVNGDTGTDLRIDSLANPADGIFNINVTSDGTGGTGTVAISVVSSAGVTTDLGSEVFTFYGDAATLTATQEIKIIRTVTSSGSVSGYTGTAPGAYDLAAILIKVKDSGGIAVPLASLSCVSSNLAVIAGCTLTEDAGTATYTRGAGSYFAQITTSAVATSGQSADVYVRMVDPADATKYLVTPSFTFKVASKTVASVALALDKTSYEPGEKATLTVTMKDSSGNAVADTWSTSTTRSCVGSDVVANKSVTGSLPIAADGCWADAGVEVYKFYVPSIAGAFTLNTTSPADGVTPVVLTATVASSGTSSEATAQAAADAAAEATDAANAATDAANAAAEAADAATAAAQDASDAVAALSAQVAEMIAGLKAQLTALTNLVIKIQKKVKA